MSSYLVPAREATAELEVKRSRFRCRVVRVETEDAARTVIAEERRAYGTARHHCSAFVLGPDAGTLRSNDDGEPSGTAGPPILDAIRGAGPDGAGLSDTVAVVTRWFGGTLLGTGGLVQAYGDAARAALAQAGAIRRELHHTLEIATDFAVAGRLEDQLRRLRGEVLVDYGSGQPILRATVAPDDLDTITTMIDTCTSGNAVITELAPLWVDQP